ncbi:MAG: DUF928 domain-containing protein [Geitlerinemataceae cyanobacterium]
MKHTNFVKVFGLLTLATGMALTGFGSALAVTFTPPGNESPRQTTGGASRSGQLCGQASSPFASTQEAVTPLLPSSNSGMTQLDRPTILVYLPETGEKEAMFSIKDEGKQLHYQMNVPISGEAGLVAIQLPEDAPALEVGKNYQWFFALKCDGKLHPSNPLVSGWIERSSSNGESAFSPSSNPDGLLQEAIALGNSGIWYDTVATLARLRTMQPDNSQVSTHWNELLASVGLDVLTTTPLADSPESAESN